jgi:protein-S-isoprenylcysteine O-methyltransferase Ste14
MQPEMVAFLLITGTVLGYATYWTRRDRAKRSRLSSSARRKDRLRLAAAAVVLTIFFVFMSVVSIAYFPEYSGSIVTAVLICGLFLGAAVLLLALFNRARASR